MEEQEKQPQNSKTTNSNPLKHPKKGEPGYDEFMRSIFKSAASNMLHEDEI